MGGRGALGGGKGEGQGGGRLMYGSPAGYSPGFSQEGMLRDMAMMMSSKDGRAGRGPESGVDGQGKEVMSNSAAARFADSFMVDMDAGAERDGLMYGEHGGVGEMLAGPDDLAGSGWPEDGADQALMGERGGDSDEVGNWGY